MLRTDQQIQQTSRTHNQRTKISSFRHTNNELAENEIGKAIMFTVASKKKNLEINLRR